jgi:Permease for cytosine/purines, uracil, thiamine, allantoin
MLRSIPDFTRYARRPSDTYIQVVAIPTMLALVGFFGIVVTSAGAVLCMSRSPPHWLRLPLWLISRRWAIILGPPAIDR